MKKIVIVDGGPRKTFNTAAMLQKIADGIASAGGDIVVQRVRPVYGIEYLSRRFGRSAKPAT